MAYQKKYATDAERSAAFSRAAKSRKHNNGGRPKGSPNKNPAAAIPVRTMKVREPDYQILTKLASVKNIHLVDFMHIVADALKARNPKIFSAAIEPNI